MAEKGTLVSFDTALIMGGRGFPGGAPGGGSGPYATTLFVLGPLYRITDTSLVVSSQLSIGCHISGVR